MDILLSPPLAFLIYLPLVIAIFLVGKGLAGKSNPNPEKSSLYGSGELAPTSIAALDTSPFFSWHFSSPCCTLACWFWVLAPSMPG